MFNKEIKNFNKDRCVFLENLVSVIMPVCNNERHLEEAIESILNQTYKNIELLILDDGSKDKSLSIIEDYAMKNKNIRLISRDNKGVAHSIDELIKYSKGEYIARMSGDDVSYKNRIETQLEYMKKNNDLSLIGSYVDVELTDYKNDDDRLMCEKIFNFKIDKDNPGIKILGGNRVCHGTFFGKSEIFKKVKYSSNLKSMEDVEFIFKLINEKYKIDMIEKKLYLNRVNSNFIHEQKMFNVNCNKENLMCKIEFLKKNLTGKNIFVLGTGKFSNELCNILRSNLNLEVEQISKSSDLKNLNNEYMFILDKENFENIENLLILKGKKILKDFILL